MSVDLHVPVAVSVQGREHDAKGARPVAEEHEQAVAEALLRKDTSPLVHCNMSTGRQSYFWVLPF